jgi:hypothetical protein
MSPRTRERLEGLRPWSGLMAAGLAYGLQHQVVSDALHFDCHRLAGAPDIVLGVFALALIAAGAFLSWRTPVAADAPAAKASMQAFIVRLSLLGASLAALGLLWLMLAGALLPGCRPA